MLTSVIKSRVAISDCLSFRLISLVPLLASMTLLKLSCSSTSFKKSVDFGFASCICAPIAPRVEQNALEEKPGTRHKGDREAFKT